MTLATPSAAELTVNAETLLGTLMEGACLGNHIFDRYKMEKEKTPVKTVILMGHGCQKKGFFRLGQIRGRLFAAPACHGQRMGDDAIQRQAAGSFRRD